MSDSLADEAPAIPDRRARVRRETDAEQNHLAHLLAQIPDAILCFDRNWIITYANSEAIRISRLHPADIHHKTHWELFP
jgi:PAS domain-containing protein